MYNQAILLGILVSLLYAEVTGLSAGLIIPGYLALNLHSPTRMVYTILVAIMAVYLCRFLAKWVILYGRRRFAAMILLTFFIGLVVDWIGLVPGGVGVIGYLIPGIIARECDRQGIATTLLSITITTGILAVILLALGHTIGG